MTNIIVYGDLQTTEGAERLYSNPTMPLQRHRVSLFYTRLKELFDQYNCHAIWDLGDTTDDRVALPLPTIDVILEGLQKFDKSPHNIKLTGNHEQYTRDTLINNGGLFKSTFQVVDDMRIFDIEGVTIIACSYPASMAQLAEKLDSALLKYRSRPLIVLGHFDVTGAKVKNGTQLTGLPLELLDSAQLTLLGHIHLPQSLSSNVHYVGSPFQQDFGEAGERKRVGLVTIDGANIQLRWIYLEGFPEYRRVSYADFTSAFDPTSEDRYEVYINNPEEATALFNHPHAARVRPAYHYQEAAESPQITPEINPWTLDAASRRWTNRYAPATRGLSISAEELLQFGLQIAQDPV